MTDSDDLFRDAETIADQLRVLRRLVRRAIEADIALGELTGPQLAVMDMLVKDEGINLKELSQRLALSHSTVSGIIDRLERRGMVRREPDPVDRRFIKIMLADQVKAYLRKHYPRQRVTPLVEALRQASPAERTQILDGLATLRRLLEASAQPEPPPSVESKRAWLPDELRGNG